MPATESPLDLIEVVVVGFFDETKLPPRLAPTWKDPVVGEVDPDDEQSVRSKGDVGDARDERMSDEEEELPTTRKDEDALITGNDDVLVEGEFVLPLIMEMLVTSDC